MAKMIKKTYLLALYLPIHIIYIMSNVLLRLSDVTKPRGNNYDSLDYRRDTKHYDIDLLAICRRSWLNKDAFRRDRARMLRYLFGDQWGDTIIYNGVEMTEREFLRSKNIINPTKNNVMVSLYNSIVGLHSKQDTEPVCFARNSKWANLSDMMSAALQSNWQNTYTNELVDFIFGESLCSGLAISRETYEEREGIVDSWTDTPNPNYVFWEGGNDPRHTDIRLIGILHDISREELYNKFARNELGLSIDKLNDIYNRYDNRVTDNYSDVNDRNDYAKVNFSCASEPGLYRVIEVWTKEVKERYQVRDAIAADQRSAYYRVEKDDTEQLKDILAENKRRKAMYDDAGVPEDDRAYITVQLIPDTYWQYTYLTPDGYILCTGESEYDNRSHPFTVSMYPFINGEIHPFMASVIDQQRAFNELMMMQEMAAKSAIKGVKFLPLSLKPDDVTVEEYVRSFSEYDSTFVYDDRKSRTGARPEFYAQSALNLGTNELLQMQLNLMHEISTVSGALQGKTPASGTSASRYALESQNASTSLYPIVKKFSFFKEKLAMKKCQMMQQFYENGRDVTRKTDDNPVFYDRGKMRDIQFKISIKESAQTPAYDMVLNDFLKELFMQGAIPVKMYIKNSNMPFKDKLLQELDNYEQQMQNGNIPNAPVQVPGVDQETANQGTSAIKNLMR